MYKGVSKDILIQCGIPSEFLTGKHGPCPLCGEGEDRYHFDNKNDSGSFMCRKCCSGTGWRLLMEYFGITYEEAVEKVKQFSDGSSFTTYSHNPQDEERELLAKNVGDLKDNLSKIVPAEGTPAETYLKSRGLDLPEQWTYRGAEVRAYYLHEDLYWMPSGQCITTSSVIWKMWRGDGKPSGLHRTFITPTGERADVPVNKKTTKRVLPKMKMEDGGYLHIPLRRGTNKILIIGEGVETTLSAWHIMKEMYNEDCSADAAFNASGVEFYRPFSTEVHHIIFADNDESLTGQLAAAGCVRRLHKNHRINVAMPKSRGEDWNDVWMRGERNEFSNIIEEFWL